MLTLIKPGIEEYAQEKTEKSNSLLKQLHRDTHAHMDYPQMLTGPIEGSFLRLMVQVSGAKNVLEIGMFTGYSALSMAEGLPANGTITTCEINPKSIEFAKKYFEKSEHGKKIAIKQGPALESIKSLEGPFELVFIDADKPNYKNYYEAVLPKVKSGGVILIDNVLWSGKVLDPKTDDDKAIAELNNFVAMDDRVDKVLLTIRDGVYFIRKK